MATEHDHTALIERYTYLAGEANRLPAECRERMLRALARQLRKDASSHVTQRPARKSHR